MSSTSGSGDDYHPDGDESPPPKRQRLSVDRGQSPAVAPVPDHSLQDKKPRPQRQATLYDAVAKSITVSGFAAARNRASQTPSTRDTHNRSGLALPPADVLFKRAAAPPRYEEPQLDLYGAHRWLPSRTATLDDADVRRAYPSAETLRQLRLQNDDQGLRGSAQGRTAAETSSLGGGGTGLPKASLQDAPASGAASRRQRRRPAQLPDSDLLKALHAYTSAFYARTSHDRGASDWRSLDETALLALGMLVEETAKEVIQNGGWRALVEGQFEEDMVRRGRDETRSVIARDFRHKRRVKTTEDRHEASASERQHTVSVDPLVDNSHVSAGEHGSSATGDDDY